MMANGINSSNNDLLKQINTSILNDNNLAEIYKLDRAEQQKKLKEIFTVVSDNDVSGTQKTQLEAGAAKLLAKVDELEKKMSNLQKEIDANQSKLSKKVDEIADMITAVGSKTSEMEKEQEKVVKFCIEDVFYEYQSGHIGKDAISGEIKRRIKNSSYKLSAKADIDKLLNEMDSKRGEINNLVSTAAGWMDETKILQQQYGVTKSAYTLIRKTIDSIGKTGTTYTNSDTDTKMPVYSIQKTEIASKFVDDANINVKSTNKTVEDNGIVEYNTKEKLDKKYAQYLKGSGVDNLNNAINAGLFNDLIKSNLTTDQVAQYIAGFNGTGYTYDAKTNTLNMPYTTTAGQALATRVQTFINGYTSNYVENTWDPDKGNTINSNKQIKSLNDNYKNVMETLGKGNPAFSFKEAMQIMFNPTNGIFKDTGISYDLSKQNGKPNYTIDAPGDSDTDALYQSVAAKIKEIWGVDATHINSLKGLTDVSTQMKTVTGKPIDNIPRPSSSDNNDPLAFEKDGKKFVFITDRNNDGKFTSFDEFVGYNENDNAKFKYTDADGVEHEIPRNWLTDLSEFDYNNDGLINESDVKDGVSALSQLKLLSNDYMDNTSISGGKYSNKIAYEMKSAESLGITKIDLSEYFDKATETYQFDKVGQRAKDVFGDDKLDANNSKIYTDGFKVTFKDGTTADASRTDDKTSFMNTVYQDAVKKDYNLRQKETDVQKVLDSNDGYKKFDDFAAKNQDVFGDYEILSNYDDVLNQTKAMYNIALDRIDRNEASLLVKASNKAASFSNGTGWSNIQNEVKEIAKKQGIDIDMEQAKGIYIIDGSLDAAGVVAKYKQQSAEYTNVQVESQQAKVAWSALANSYKNGVMATADEINQILKDGKAGNTADVVNVLKNQNKIGSLSYVLNGISYEFALDRAEKNSKTNEGNGKIDGKNELLGGEEGTSMYDDLNSLATNKGSRKVITGDNLAKLKILTDDPKSKINSDDKYGVTNARALGIEEIDITGATTDEEIRTILQDSLKKAITNSKLASEALLKCYKYGINASKTEISNIISSSSKTLTVNDIIATLRAQHKNNK